MNRREFFAVSAAAVALDGVPTEAKQYSTIYIQEPWRYLGCGEYAGGALSVLCERIENPDGTLTLRPVDPEHSQLLIDIGEADGV